AYTTDDDYVVLTHSLDLSFEFDGFRDWIVLWLMGRFQVFPGLHFQQPRFGPLEFKAQSTARVQVRDGSFGRYDDLDVSVIELINHVDKAPGLVVDIFAHNRHIADNHRVEFPGQLDVIVLTARA